MRNCPKCNAKIKVVLKVPHEFKGIKILEDFKIPHAVCSKCGWEKPVWSAEYKEANEGPLLHGVQEWQMKIQQA